VTVPVSVVISNLIAFGIQFFLFLFLLLLQIFRSDIHPQYALIILPLLIVQLAALGLGFGIIVSSMTTRYRDLTHLVGFGVQLWMFATPVVYPASSVLKNGNGFLWQTP
jgi:lipopolysaccharide transport system permease protein